ncbi:TPA: hypothetical protein ACGUWV_004703 [Vibrio vulnificus]|jgi:hypothetical protein
MKKIIGIISLLFGLSINPVYAEAPSLDSIAFAAKHSINSDLFKNAEYENGESFPLGKYKTAYSLYFSGVYQGRQAVMKINCKADNATGDIEYCKPVRLE